MSRNNITDNDQNLYLFESTKVISDLVKWSQNGLVKSIVYQWSFQKKHFCFMVLINRSQKIIYDLSNCISNYIRYLIHFTYEYLEEVSCSSLWWLAIYYICIDNVQWQHNMVCSCNKDWNFLKTCLILFRKINSSKVSYPHPFPIIPCWRRP